jgi:hypothetical protein
MQGKKVKIIPEIELKTHSSDKFVQKSITNTKEENP